MLISAFFSCLRTPGGTRECSARQRQRMNQEINIIKQIDYEQIRDRTVILENNHAEQGNKGVVAPDSGPSRNIVGETKDAEGGTIQISEKSKYDLGGTQKDGLDDESFTPFKIELEDFDRRKRRSKKKKKERGL